MPPVTSPARPIRVALWVIGGFNLVSALVGMVGLTIGGGMGLPPQWLDGTGFASYAWPGVILGVVVGGVQAVALVAQHRRRHLAWGLHAVAGLVMMTWIFVEVAIILVWVPLQGVFFTSGLIQAGIATLALGAWPRSFLGRTRERPKVHS